MLINFTVENWMSFRDKTTFTTIASGEKQHADNLIHIEKYNLKLTPVAAIYGANASGKSNLLEAMNFIRGMIFKQNNELIQVNPFKLEDSEPFPPCKFCLEIFQEETIYEYSFSATREKIVEEKLIEILPSKEILVYERVDDKFKFGKGLKTTKNNETGDMTLANKHELFIPNAINNKTKLTQVHHVFTWFRNSFPLLDTSMKIFPLGIADLEMARFQLNVISSIVKYIDAGIDKFDIKITPFDEQTVTKEFLDIIHNEIRGKGSYTRTDGSAVAYNDSGKLEIRSIIVYHNNNENKKVYLAFSEESEGTKRLCFLLNCIYLLFSYRLSSTVIFIDEIDSSMHELLSKTLIETVHKTSNKDRRSQLIFTTHDTRLMDQELMRRDEMWLVKKDNEGASHIYSIGDFDGIRSDKKIDKMYLRGQLGGIPNIDTDEIINIIQDLESTNK